MARTSGQLAGVVTKARSASPSARRECTSAVAHPAGQRRLQARCHAHRPPVAAARLARVRGWRRPTREGNGPGPAHPRRSPSPPETTPTPPWGRARVPSAAVLPPHRRLGRPRCRAGRALGTPGRPRESEAAERWARTVPRGAHAPGPRNAAAESRSRRGPRGPRPGCDSHRRRSLPSPPGPASAAGRSPALAHARRLPSSGSRSRRPCTSGNGSRRSRKAPSDPAPRARSRAAVGGVVPRSARGRTRTMASAQTTTSRTKGGAAQRRIARRNASDHLEGAPSRGERTGRGKRGQADHRQHGQRGHERPGGYAKAAQGRQGEEKQV